MNTRIEYTEVLVSNAFMINNNIVTKIHQIFISQGEGDIFQHSTPEMAETTHPYRLQETNDPHNLLESTSALS